MVHRKGTVIRVLGHNSSILARMQLQPSWIRIISDSRAFIWCADRLYMPYTFEISLMKKKKERRKKKNKIDIFAFDFLDCDEKSWDSGALFDIRIANGFHL